MERLGLDLGYSFSFQFPRGLTLKKELKYAVISQSFNSLED